MVIVTLGALSCMLVCKELSTAITTSNTGSKEGKYANGAGYQGKLGEGYPNKKKEKHDSKCLWCSWRSSLEPVKKRGGTWLWDCDHYYTRTIIKSIWDFLHSPRAIPEIVHIPYRLICKSPVEKLIVCLVFNQFPLKKRCGLAPSMPHFNTEL